MTEVGSVKKALVAGGVLASAGAVSLALVAAQYEPVLPAGARVGPVDVSGLKRPEAGKKLRTWWETERRRLLTFTCPELAKPVPSGTASSFGLMLDDVASVKQIPLEGLWAMVGRRVAIRPTQSVVVKPVFSLDRGRLAALRRFVSSSSRGSRPARATLVGSKIKLEPERSGFELDESRLLEAAVSAMGSGGAGILPVVPAKKKLSDEQLAQISEVVSTFSTRFKGSQASRSSNIRLAAQRLNGIVLAPGEQLSFNQTVGRRTVEAGFQIAGVYINGKKDKGIGGGICQVSTTMYNAVLLANLALVSHRNHSLPVPYVPIGRDATVDYGSIDLVIKNDKPWPIAIASKVEPSKLTFAVLGKREPGVSVKIETERAQSWSRGVSYVQDSSLPAGGRRVVEPGAAAHSVYTYRIVFKDGVQLARQALGRSYYPGSPRVVAISRAAPAPEAAPAPPKPPEQAVSP